MSQIWLIVGWLQIFLLLTLNTFQSFTIVNFKHVIAAWVRPATLPKKKPSTQVFMGIEWNIDVKWVKLLILYQTRESA